ncbi:MAG: pyridoxine 5'-phosphate synthase [Bacteroides sp.]|nr:MAG: pyridoxine 5'-phosphate synthase [Bacteroides sp.]
MTKLSVNINKIATLRNARGENNPDVIHAALNCIKFGANSITVHPRPDERHIKYKDVFLLRDALSSYLNIEGYPSEKFINLIKEIRPNLCTLVPDKINAITSCAGWNIMENKIFLKKIIDILHSYNVKVSIFIEPDINQVLYAKKINADVVELYTKKYADLYLDEKENAIKDYYNASIMAKNIGIRVNAGHDLNITNIEFFCKNIQYLHEVSIGHAIICDSIYYGLQNTISMYKKCIEIK